MQHRLIPHSIIAAVIVVAALCGCGRSQRQPHPVHPPTAAAPVKSAAHKSPPQTKASPAPVQRVPRHFEQPVWKVGQWAEYRISDVRNGKSRTMRLTTSLVGEENVAGIDCVWQEIDVATAGQKEVCTKYLVPKPGKGDYLTDPTRFFFGVSAKARPIRVLTKDPDTGTVYETPLETTNDADSESSVPTGDAWRFDGKAERFPTATGTVTAYHFSARATHGSFEGWRSPEVPITGLAKMVMRNQTVGTTEMTLLRCGRSGTRSKVTGKIVTADEYMKKMARQARKDIAKAMRHGAGAAEKAQQDRGNSRRDTP